MLPGAFDDKLNPNGKYQKKIIIIKINIDRKLIHWRGVDVSGLSVISDKLYACRLIRKNNKPCAHGKLVDWK